MLPHVSCARGHLGGFGWLREELAFHESIMAPGISFGRRGLGWKTGGSGMRLQTEATRKCRMPSELHAGRNLNHIEAGPFRVAWTTAGFLISPKQACEPVFERSRFKPQRTR